MSANYYVDTADGKGDALICGGCVERNGLRDDSPVDPEVFSWAPLGCAIHVYGGDPGEYAKKSTDEPTT